jgi:hypothetical protein
MLRENILERGEFGGSCMYSFFVKKEMFNSTLNHHHGRKSSSKVFWNFLDEEKFSFNYA